MIRFLPGYTSATPFNHPRIGYESYSGTITGTAGATYGPDVVAFKNTYERWNPEGGGTLTLDLLGPQPVSYVGIAAHALAGHTITLEWSADNISYTQLYSDTETSATALLFVFTEVQANYIRVTISGGNFGVLFVGRILEMYRSLYAGHMPVTLSRRTVKNKNESIAGQYLNCSIIRTGFMSDYSFSNIPIDWYQSNLEPLSLAARTSPIFMAWNPLGHPDQTVYGDIPDDIKPTLSGTLNFCDVEFSINGYT